MISALTKGYQVLGDEKYLAAAQRCANFIEERLSSGEGELLRRYRDGESKFSAFLDDYAYLIQALIDLYESDSQSKWISWACELQSIIDQKFWDSEQDAYFYTEVKDLSVIIRKKDYTDGAIPSGNGVSALNLQRLYHLTLDETYKERSDKIISALSNLINQFPSALASSLLALDFATSSVKQIAVVGEPSERKPLTEYLYSQFLPNKVLALKDKSEDDTDISFLNGKVKKDGKVAVYLCEDNTCKAPLSNLEDLKHALRA